jgi:glycosyltransferase involved in cell wall biosynthesis
VSASRFRRTSSDEKIVFYLGRLSPRKRVDLLVQAAAALRADGVDLRLAIAGSDAGAGRSLRRQIRACGMQDHTVMLGLLRGRDRLDALAAADLLVYPGDHEVFGLVVAEALLCGTPVVVADDCGAAEIVRETGGGLAARAGDAAALADAIRRVLLAPAAFEGPVEEAGLRIRRRFGADAVCERLEAVYAEMARQVRR